jgi:hypothetical protein
MGRHRKSLLPHMDGSGNDADMGSVTAATLPPDIPQNPDGSVRVDGDVDEFQAQKIGALSVESAAKNKSVAKKMTDKALGQSVRWNTDNALEMFDILKEVFAGEWGSISISLLREEPGPASQFPPIQASTIKDVTQLYAYIDGCHGSSGPATYKVTWRFRHIERGTARIRMPDKSAPPAMQILQPSQNQQQPQFATPPYPTPYGSGGQGGMGGMGGMGYYPPQQQPQQQPQVILVSPPGSAPSSPMAPHLAPAPAPVQAAPTPSASPELQRLVEQMGQQQVAMMTVLKELMDVSRRPSGFVALPEGYPIAPGYVAVPGGMIPNPLGAHVPQPAPVPVSPAPVMAIAQPTPAPPPNFDSQLSGAFRQVSSLLKGMQDMQGLITQFGGGVPVQGRPNVVEEEEEPEPAASSPVTTTQIGDISMVFNAKDGGTNWPATIMGALPKIINVAKDGLHEYQKVIERQAALTNQAVEKRIQLARAVQGVQQAVQAGTPAVLPAGPPPQQAPAPPPPQQVVSQPSPPASPPIQVRPAQTSPAPASAPETIKVAPKMPIPSVPLWGMASSAEPTT